MDQTDNCRKHETGKLAQNPAHTKLSGPIDLING